MNPLITKLRADRDALKASLEALNEIAATENRDLDGAEEANFNEGAEKLEALNKRLESLESMELRNAEAAALSAKVDEATKGGTVKVKSEALTYREDGEHDFMRDVFAAQVRNDFSARERLGRHTEEMADEYRAVVKADLAGLVVPKYMTDLYAPIAHEGRPFANIVNRQPLTAATAYITKGVTDVAVDVQTEELETVATADPDATDLTITAKTIAGSVEVSRQALDFGALNGSMLTQDLFRKYAQKLDYQVLNGSGNSGQHKGVLNASGTNAIDGASVTSYKQFWEKVAQAKTAVHKSFVGNATHIVMNSDLYGWLVAQTDSEGRPLLAFPGSAPQNVGGSEGIFNGLTVVVDDNIPSTSNGSLNPLQKAIVTNAKELFLFEQNGGTPLTISVDQVGATALKVAFVAYGYSAFTAERYPKATSIISGLALA